MIAVLPFKCNQGFGWEVDDEGYRCRGGLHIIYSDVDRLHADPTYRVRVLLYENFLYPEDLDAQRMQRQLDAKADLMLERANVLLSLDQEDEIRRRRSRQAPDYYVGRRRQDWGDFDDVKW